MLPANLDELLKSGEVIDVEQCAKNGKTPEREKKYLILIDRVRYVVDDCLTGRELLLAAGKDPQRFQLRQSVRHGGKVVVELVKLDQQVCFTKPGIEKFMTLPLDQQEGEIIPRRQFRLPEEDIEFLEGQELAWETIVDSSGSYVFIHDVPVPEGYNHRNITIAIRIESGYPQTQLDMVYLYPALLRLDGQPIGALCDQPIDGKVFQRWSRHRTVENAWRPGVDSLATHMGLVSYWFEQEFIKRPRLHAVPA
ncbi:MAG: hypothetical protein J7527_03080 [Chitinophagaceae bacterium]|nr:hypothetical protein [Chitinophagaceae bacterium]